jgi:hypothetical protein
MILKVEPGGYCPWVARLLSGRSRFGDFVEHAHTATQRIDFDLLAAALAAQQLFPAPLQAVLTDLVADHVAFFPENSELFLVDLAEIAEHVRRHRTVGIAAPRAHAQGDARKFELVRFDGNHRGPVDVAAKHHLVERRPAFAFLEDAQKFFFIALEIARQQPQRGARIVGIFGNKDKVEGWPAVDQKLAVAIVNHAARPRHALDAYPVVLRKKSVTLAGDHLEEEQPRHQTKESHGQKGIQPAGAPAELGCAVLFVDFSQ